MQGTISKPPFVDVELDCLEEGVERFWDKVRNFLGGGVRGGLFGIPSNDAEGARDRFPGNRVSICDGREGGALATWGSARMIWRPSGGSADVGSSSADDNAGRGKIGDGFARTTTTESGSGVDVFRWAGNDGGRYGYSRTAIREVVSHDLTVSHRFWYICNLGRIILYRQSFRGLPGTSFIIVDRRCNLWYIGWF